MYEIVQASTYCSYQNFKYQVSLNLELSFTYRTYYVYTVSIQSSQTSVHVALSACHCAGWLVQFAVIAWDGA